MLIYLFNVKDFNFVGLFAVISFYSKINVFLILTYCTFQWLFFDNFGGKTCCKNMFGNKRLLLVHAPIKEGLHLVEYKKEQNFSADILHNLCIYTFHKNSKFHLVLVHH